ncbi:MAG: recombinase family protein [Defluviitaleaceae bacterium]|nr:recombinase family protein [Defluviitaleaceae bacterium]
MTVALYMRISVDDGTNQESNSISNQRELLRQYVASDAVLSKHNVVEHLDDGYSGTNFERPAIKRLLEDVRRGKVQCIVVKDFSRFGRSYIEVGDFLEQVFPFLGVRFISIGDNYDSDSSNANSSSTIEVALKTLIYDLYSKDLSVKVKSGLDTKKRGGKFAASRPPYGYEKCKVAKNGLAINESQAEIVRYIFQLTSEGKRPSVVARLLNEQDIPTRGNKPNSFWKRSDISEVVMNESYTGAAIANKTRQVYPGSKKQIPNPKEEWTVIYDAHPAIISRELFERVNNNLPKIKSRNTQEVIIPYVFKGKLRCHHCGYTLQKVGNPTHFYCSTPRVHHSPECIIEPVAEVGIKEVVLSVLSSHAALFLKKSKAQKQLTQSSNDERKQLEDAVQQLEISKRKLYESYKDGKIDKEVYLSKRDRLNAEIALAAEEIASQKETLALSNLSNTDDNKKEAWDLFSQNHELNFEIVDALIEKIIVHKTNKIEVKLKYADGFNPSA